MPPPERAYRHLFLSSIRPSSSASCRPHRTGLAAGPRPSPRSPTGTRPPTSTSRSRRGERPGSRHGLGSRTAAAVADPQLGRYVRSESRLHYSSMPLDRARFVCTGLGGLLPPAASTPARSRLEVSHRVLGLSDTSTTPEPTAPG